MPLMGVSVDFNFNNQKPLFINLQSPWIRPKKECRLLPCASGPPPSLSQPFF